MLFIPYFDLDDFTKDKNINQILLFIKCGLQGTKFRLSFNTYLQKLLKTVTKLLYITCCFIVSNIEFLELQVEIII